MPFQQVGDNQNEGAGLGLAITQNLVKLLNADLQVNSVLGQGTEFCVTIALPESQQAQTTSDSQIVGYQGSLKTLLIADTTWEHRASLKHILSPLNFNLLEADSEDTILEKLAQQPDVVLIHPQLLQQQMLIPVLESFPLIMIENDAATEIGLHYQAIITQPFDKKCILEYLQRILNLKWIMQQNDTEQAANMESHFDTALISQHYPLSKQQIQHLYDLSMKGDIKGLLHFAQTLQSNKTLLPLAQHIHQLAKQLQLEHIYQIATHYQDTLQ